MRHSLVSGMSVRAVGIGIVVGVVGSMGWYKWNWIRGEQRERARLQKTQELAAVGVTPTVAVAQSGSFGLVTRPTNGESLTAPPEVIVLTTEREVRFERLQLTREAKPSPIVLRPGAPERGGEGKTMTLPFPAGQGKGTYALSYTICEAKEPSLSALPTPATGSSRGPAVTITPEQVGSTCTDGSFSFTVE